MDKLDKVMAWVESWTPYDAFVFNGPILAGLFLSICGLPFFKSLIGSFCVI